MTLVRRGRAPWPVLHVVTDDDVLAREDFSEAARGVLRAGGARTALHLRGPATPGGRLHALAQALVGPAGEAGALLVVNDRVDLALATGAGGVHLGARSLPVGEARRLLGAGVGVGCSVHDPGEARRAASEGADWLFAGSVHETPSHPGRAPLGLGGLAAVCREAGGVPVVAIGGMTPGRVAEAVAAGARGVAAIRGVWGAADPGAAVGDYLQALSVAGGANEGEDMDAIGTTIRVRLNGKDRELEAGHTVRSLLESLELHPGMVVVERNKEILARDSYGETQVRDGDTLELVHFVGGG